MTTPIRTDATWRRHLRSGLGLKHRGPFDPPRPLIAPPTAPPRPAGKVVTFFAKPAYIVFAWTFGVLMLMAGAYAFIDISSSVSELEADGNQFAGLVWTALPARLIVDGFIVALIAGFVTVVAAIVAAVSNPKR